MTERRDHTDGRDGPPHHTTTPPRHPKTHMYAASMGEPYNMYRPRYCQTYARHHWKALDGTEAVAICTGCGQLRAEATP